MLTPQQLELRKSGLGSSEIAQVVGCSPFGDASKLWMVKTGRWPDEVNAALLAGTWLEDGVAQWAADQQKWKLQKIHRTLRHKKHAWCLATPDRFIVESRKRVGQVEVKTSMSIHTHDGWGDEWTDQVPSFYRCQVQQQMTVTGEKRTILVLFTFIDRQLRFYQIDHSPALEAVLLEAGYDFWTNHVQTDEPPSLDPASPFAAKYLARMQKQLSDSVIQAPLRSDAIARDLYKATVDLADAEKREAIAQNQLKEMVGEAKGIEAPWGRFLWSKCKGKVSDGKLADELMNRLAIERALVTYLATDQRAPPIAQEQLDLLRSSMPTAMSAPERAQLREQFRGEDYRKVTFTYKDVDTMNKDEEAA